MVPVGAVLPHAVPVGEGFAGTDAWKADTRHAIHVGGQQNAVPVDRGVLVESVGHPQRHRLALAKAQDRSGYGAIDCDGGAAPAAELKRSAGNDQIRHLVATDPQVATRADPAFCVSRGQDAECVRHPQGGSRLNETSACGSILRCCHELRLEVSSRA